MITEFKVDKGYGLIIKSNQSLSWTQQKNFLGISAVSFLIIGGGFAIQGFWPILLMFVLMWLLLAMASWKTIQQNRKEERITFSNKKITFEKANNTKQKTDHDIILCSFNTAWVRLKYLEGIKLQKSKLTLTESGKSIEIAQFLGDEEKEALYQKLKTYLHDENTFKQFNS